jgi:sulfur carrier protein
MQVTLNGVPTEVADGLTVAGLVAQRSGPDQRIAIAVDNEVVPRSAWAQTALGDGDVVEVLTAVAGG